MCVCKESECVCVFKVLGTQREKKGETERKREEGRDREKERRRERQREREKKGETQREMTFMLTQETIQ